MMTEQEARDQLIEDIASFTHDPYGYVLYAYPWGQAGTELENSDGPREWQVEAFQEIADHLSNPETRFEPLMLARASGHGIGKSAFISMLIKWGMDTCKDTRVVATANTDNQLRTKTWPEVQKWQRLAITSDWFTTTATSVYSNVKGHASAWRADAIPWSEHNTEAFAGLHNEGKRIILVFDEASKIADLVWEVAEGALTDANTEIIWVAFGNPTRNTGRFRECFRKFRHRWKGARIDSRNVEGTNKKQIQKWLEDYGEDHDWFKVRVRGQFPSQSFKQFIPNDLVDAARKRHYRPEQYTFAPVILTCDPAWEGDDDLVISKRQGLVFQVLKVIPKNDNDVHVANLIANLEDEHKADAVFVDGGYGTGIVSAGRTMGRTWTLVWFGEAATNKGYTNKRSEMWGAAKEWLREGGAIPDDDVLAEELIGPETVPRLDGKIQIEGKKDMKARGLPSPNRADSLILSFAHPVIRQEHRGAAVSEDWDPFG